MVLSNCGGNDTGIRVVEAECLVSQVGGVFNRFLVEAKVDWKAKALPLGSGQKCTVGVPQKYNLTRRSEKSHHNPSR